MKTIWFSHRLMGAAMVMAALAVLNVAAKEKEAAATVTKPVSAPAGMNIYMAGDSTMCLYGQRAFPQQGWGQRLPDYCVDGVRVHDMARGGRSSKTFITEGIWDKLVASLQPGDFVIIAFGHNDAPPGKGNTKAYRVFRSTKPAEYRTNFVKYVTDVRAKGAIPILATSIIHSGGWKDGKIRAGAAGIGPYLAVTRELAKELKVELIDLNAYAEQKFNEMGKAEADKLYIHLQPGESPNYPKGREDKCHICDKGAVFYAAAAVKLAKEQKLSIAKLFKDSALP